MRKPLNGNPAVTTPFGGDAATYKQFGLNGHHGTDYGVGVGQPVYAAEAGTVLMSANGVTDQYTGAGVAGETIVVKGQRYEEWYLHLSDRLVSKGTKVKEGQLIGYSGNTGVATGPHLHFGTRPLKPNVNNGYRGFVDPEAVLNQAKGTAMQYSQIQAKDWHDRIVQMKSLWEKMAPLMISEDPALRKRVRALVDKYDK